MPNGTHGGVRGELTFAYSILIKGLIMFTRHTAAVFSAVFLLALAASLSLLAIFYFPEFFIIIYISSVICAIAAVNGEDHPEYRLSRLSLSVIFPIFAAPLCLLLKRRISKYDRELMKADFKLGGRSDFEKKLSSLDERAAGTVRSLLADDEYSVVSDNSSCTYYSEGEEMLKSMLRDIKEARRYIFLEYYIISDGAVWNVFSKALTERAESGVEVRVMFDDIGSMRTLPVSYAKRLCDAGIKAEVFYPISGRVSIHNNRDHRKILVIDGDIAYTGGLNLADEYANYTAPHGYWKESGIRVTADAAAGLCLLFLSLWDFNKRERTEHGKYIRGRESEKKHEGLCVSFGTAPKPLYKANAGKRLIVNILNQAKRYVYITTPYLVPDFEILCALKNAAARGVLVSIVTPGVADKILMKIITESFYRELVSAGVGIYEYTPGFMHGKIIVSDDELALVGSLNLDYRSLAHNFECGILAFEKSVVGAIRDDALSVISVSKRVEASAIKFGIRKKAVRLIAGAMLPIL